MTTRFRGPIAARAWPAALALATIASAGATGASGQRGGNAGAVSIDPIVFVSRQIPSDGSIYLTSAHDMPGVGARSRFRIAAPGQLVVREADGRLRILVDGRRPSPASLNLIDVNAPDVSYDGRRIVFAGLPAGTYDKAPNVNPSAWRIFSINADGSGVTAITRSDQHLDLSQFQDAAPGLEAYDDTDPVWLPDGRIVFSSTRWPSFGHYSGVRTTNLYVVDADGANLHRITAERNGADRPLIDPLTGKIVYSRWWRNQRFPIDSEQTISRVGGGLLQKGGLTADRDVQLTGAPDYANFEWRNVWNPASINPDGTDLKAWGGSFLHDGDGSANHVYGGAVAPDGTLFANFFPMFNMTEAAGFGGIRRFSPGAEPYTPVLGVTEVKTTYFRSQDPKSYGIYAGPYAAEPAVLSDGTLIISFATGIDQDYGLYRIAPDGSGRTLVFDAPGTTELRARSLSPRSVPPRIRDQAPARASLLPPAADGPYDGDGTFVFNALNVYANAPVDTDIVNAPAVGSGARLRFFIDHQRTSPGSYPHLDWPILLEEQPISAAGAVRANRAPANVPLFEQMRGPDNRVPITRGPSGELGAAHVAGLNFGRPGALMRCVGCHIGHSMIAVPDRDEDAAWSNLAPGATVTASSSRTAGVNAGVNDRRALKADEAHTWSSKPGSARTNQWVQLEFAVPVSVRTVRLYAPARSERSDLKLLETRVVLLDDRGTTVGTNFTGEVRHDGTDLSFSDVTARRVRIEFRQITGSFLGESVAALSEVEVIGRGVTAN